ncbi:MAG: VOC family protein [Proteobacteria bacterium]|nr:VOC family protein [Pseudomonadota bacterium]
MTAAIEHIHFLCADPEKTAAFFATYLDAEEVERVTMPDWLIIRLKIGAAIIALSPKRGAQVLAEPPRPPYRGFSHIGLTVSAVDELVERMRGDGVPVTVEPFEIAPGVRAAYVLAPDDIELELLQPPQA